MQKGFFVYTLIGIALVISASSFASEQTIQPLNQSASDPVVTQKVAASSPSGQAIYNKTCVACHGVNGKGVSPTFPDFTQPGGVLTQPYDVLLHNTIHGIGSMPPKGGYPSLSDKDMKDALDYIMLHFPPGSTPAAGGTQTLQQIKQEITVLTQKVAKLEAAQGVSVQTPANSNVNAFPAVAQGKQIYQKNCSGCHGANGKGVVPSAPDFTHKGGILSQPRNRLFHNIKFGMGSMPAKGGNSSLSDNELKATLDYIENTFPSGEGNVATKNQKGNASNNQTAHTQQPNPTETAYFWPNPDITSLLTGSASAGYSTQRKRGSFDILDFNPVFLFRYKDFLFMQASVDFSLDDDANTNVSLDTLNLNLFLNNNMILGVGEYDTPIGYFVQNLSPAWINRLPTAPVGFDSDEAAPQAQLGAQLRGGFNLSPTINVNYIGFAGNAPRAFGDSTTGMIDHISTDPFINNFGNYIGGGRIGILPYPNFEIGISGATGKMVLLDSNTNDVLDEDGHYITYGADFSFKWRNWDFRAEVIQQKITSVDASSFPQSASWKAWYVQAAYLISAVNLQPVVRWGGYTAAASEQSLHQVALGLDYWIAPSIAIQAAYEINTEQAAIGNNKNPFLIQLVFGF